MDNADMPAMPMPMTMMGPNNEHIANEPEFGLTKREYFAGLAMQGILSDPDGQTSTQAALTAVLYADALLAQLNKEAGDE